jgi:excinuclease ABC subunit C
LKSEYRRYRIESNEINDYGMLYEVLKRRLRDGKERGDLPDLIIIDGGKGHLGIGIKAIEEEGLKNIDVISIAKGRRRMKIGDRVYTPKIVQGISISPSSRTGRLLMRIRDEAHRFAIEYHRKRREKGLTELSLLKIPGIGEKRAKLLLSKYLGLEGIIEAPIEEISSLLRISYKQAEELKELLKKLRSMS